MTILLCLVFLFLHTSTANFKSRTLAPPLNCPNITCPPIVAPLCVRVMKKNQTAAEKKSIFIVALNKCEMQFMKCHQGIEAAVVPMKKCEAVHNKPISKPIGIKKRAKRQAADPVTVSDVNPKVISLKGNKIAKMNIGSDENVKRRTDDRLVTIPLYNDDDDVTTPDTYHDPEIYTPADDDDEPTTNKPYTFDDETTTERPVTSYDEYTTAVPVTYDDEYTTKSRVTIDDDYTTETRTTFDDDDFTEARTTFDDDYTTEARVTSDDKYTTKAMTSDDEYTTKSSVTSDIDDEKTPKDPITSDGEVTGVDNDVTKKPPNDGTGSDFDSQMKKFEEDMSKFHEEFHHSFPNVDTGNGKKVKKLNNVAAKYKAFDQEMSAFEKDVKKFDSEIKNRSPKVGAEPMEGDIEDGEAEEDKDDDENDQHSPEHPVLVMPPYGGGMKKLSVGDNENGNEEQDNGEDVENNEDNDEPKWLDEGGDEGPGHRKLGTPGITDEYPGNNGEDDGTGGQGEDNSNVQNMDDDGQDIVDRVELKMGDWKYYTGECPKECPSRDVMVCARCTHDVYRTFLSTCHLRMFACAQPEEKLQLVSRTACAASAPFLADLSDDVERVTETGDDDTVLRYVYCRLRGLTGGMGPQIFRETNAKCAIAKPV